MSLKQEYFSEIIKINFMLTTNHLRKSLFFCLMLIILTQCGPLGNPEIVQEEVKQHEDVLAKITSDHQVSIYQKDQADWVLTQEIETDAEILGIFLTGEFLAIEEEGYYLSLYQGRKMESFEKEYEWRARIQLNREQKVQTVEIQEKSLAVRFEQTTDLYDFSGNKTWKNFRNERMMQTSVPTFQPFVDISTEKSGVFGMRLKGDYLVYSGHISQLKLAKYNDSAFQQVFVTPDNSFTSDVEFDVTRKWLFQGQQNTINLYADEGSGYQLKQAFDHNFNHLPHFMDVHQDYFLICTYSHFSLFKWDGSYFNLEYNFSQTINDQFDGVKMCSDNTILATIQYVNGTAGFKVYNSTNYQQTQELLVEEKGFSYTLSATDDCETVVLTPIFTSQPGKIYVVHRNATGHFMMFSNYTQPRHVYTNYPCIHPNGDFFIITKSDGSDVWLRNHESGEYTFHSTIGDSSQEYGSCGINNELIVLGDWRGNVRFSLKNPQETQDPETQDPETQDPETQDPETQDPETQDPETQDPETQDPETQDPETQNPDVSISQPQLLPDVQRKPIDIAFIEDYIVVGDQYSGSSAYKQESESFSLEDTLDHGQFLSSLDSEDSLQLLVQGSYDRTAYVYKKSDSGLSSVQNISTESQILDVDVDADGRLLLGHMNGDISEYSWNSSMFNVENKFPTAGARIYGVKSCPNQQIVALKEKEGRFHLVLMGASGDEKQSQQLGQLLAAKFAVADDCSKVFISTTMSMQVQVFVMQEGQYSLFRTVQEEFPLYDIAINPEADMFVVNRHTDHSSAVYRYDSCTEDYELEEVLKGTSDHYVVEMTDDRIALGGLDGQVAVYDYTYSIREACESFGLKKLSPISDVTTVAHTTRSIANLDVSADLVLASSLYSGVLLFQIPDSGEASVTTFNEITFVSSVTIVSALKAFAVGTFNNSVFVYIDSGSGYQLNQTIQTDSQVTSIDLCLDNKLLVGMMNGNLAEYSSDGSSFSSPATTSNANSQVYAVQLCASGAKVAILEAAGIFSLVIFLADASEPVSFVDELGEEFIEPYLSVSEDCSVIAVSGVSMQKVQVFRKEAEYKLFSSIEIGIPLSKVSVEQDGDILVVPSVVVPASYVYHYHHCTQIYTLIDTLESGTYDEATAINGQYILQGNENGAIKVSEYSYTYDGTCESKDSSSTLRTKSSNPEVQNSEDPEEDYKKMLTTDSEIQDKLSSQGDVMSPGIIFLIVLGSVLVFFIITLIRWMQKKEPKNEENQEKATTESAKQIQSQQTF